MHDVSQTRSRSRRLSRMAKRHTLHLLNHTSRAELISVSTPEDAELAWARDHLQSFGVAPYKSYEEMLDQVSLQAVVTASVTSVHADQTIKAIVEDKYVLYETPLSTDVGIVNIPSSEHELFG